MKAKIIILLLIAVSIQFVQSQQKELYLGFTGMPHTLGRLYNGNSYYYYWEHWGWFQELGLNTWQGWNAGSNQWHLVYLDSSNYYGLKGYYQPDTLIYTANGKISIHEAEETATGGGDVGRFRYNNHHNKGIPIDDNWQGQVQRVQYYEALPTGPYDPVPVLTEVNENAENSYSGVCVDPVKDYFGKPNNYYIKPRIRIDRDVALGLIKEVVKIVILAYDGEFLDSITIYTNDFRHDNQNTYDGRYLEDYFFRNMVVEGTNLNRGRDHWYLEWNNLEECHVDYQLYWYGGVSVWIDYVKVMDEAANKLFGPDQRYRDAIKHQVKSLLDRDGANNTILGFYTERNRLQPEPLVEVSAGPFFKGFNPVIQLRPEVKDDFAF